MHPQGPGFTASIPAAYTQTDFPLQYYFETQGPQEPRLFPGFGKDFLGQPYFLLLPA
jgi:hypothetical protein